MGVKAIYVITLHRGIPIVFADTYLYCWDNCLHDAHINVHTMRGQSLGS